jgi:hypothetical protein
MFRTNLWCFRNACVLDVFVNSANPSGIRYIWTPDFDQSWICGPCQIKPREVYKNGRLNDTRTCFSAPFHRYRRLHCEFLWRMSLVVSIVFMYVRALKFQTDFAIWMVSFNVVHSLLNNSIVFKKNTYGNFFNFSK